FDSPPIVAPALGEGPGGLLDEIAPSRAVLRFIRTIRRWCTGGAALLDAHVAAAPGAIGGDGAEEERTQDGGRSTVDRSRVGTRTRPGGRGRPRTTMGCSDGGHGL